LQMVRGLFHRFSRETIAKAAPVCRRAIMWLQRRRALVSELITSRRAQFEANRVRLPIIRAKSWLWYDRTRIRTIPWLRHHVSKVAVLALGLGFVGSMLLAANFEAAVQPHFTPERLARLSTLLVTVGGALVGATAISFSVVVFSVQINVERTPDGLFQTLSRDQRLIVAFVATVGLSVIGAALSLTVDAGYVARTSVAAIWIVIFVPSLIVYAYLRALKLINPRHQIQLLLSSSVRYLSRWSKRADHATPLILASLQVPPPNEPDNVFDYARALFFRSNNTWATMPSHAISQAMTFARNYSKTGDGQVVAHALYAIVKINGAYIKTKGRTFYSHNPLVNDNRSSDGIITHTLEAYRQNIRSAVKNNDETEIMQFLSGLGLLISEYSNIRYPRRSDSHYHASLAKGYMTQEVLQMLPHVSTDVMMRGAANIAELSGLFLRAPDLSAQQGICSALITIAEHGLKYPQHRPATVRALERITQISMMLIRAPEGDAAGAHEKVTRQLFQFAEFVFSTPDAGFTTPHAEYLSPYFGGGNVMDMGTFDAQLTDLVNQAVLADEGNESARRVIDNLADWSEDLPQRVRRLLEKATESRTRYSASIVWWIINVSTALYAASTATSGDQGDRETLKDRAGWIISAIDFIPHDEHGVAVMGAVDIPEQLLRMSGQLRELNLIEEAKTLGRLIERWLLRTIPHTGAHEVAEGMFGLGTLYAYLQEPQAVRALCSNILQQLPLQAGYTAAFKAALSAQITQHLNNVERNRIDGMSYVEHMADNVPNALLKANTEAILHAIEGANA
jgi:hypothetical protein